MAQNETMYALYLKAWSWAAAGRQEAPNAVSRDSGDNDPALNAAVALGILDGKSSAPRTMKEVASDVKTLLEGEKYRS